MSPGSSLRRQLLVVCGPSGCGKSTLINRLLSEFPNKFGFSISHTTRSPRKGERDGVEYHFVSRERMQADIENDMFLEHAEVHSNHYGTSFKAIQTVQESGKVCLLDVDVQGVDAIKLHEWNLLTDIVYLMIIPPNLATLESRLRNRMTETEEAIQRRLTNAAAEMEYAKRPDYWTMVLINDDFQVCYNSLCALVRQRFGIDQSQI